MTYHNPPRKTRHHVAACALIVLANFCSGSVVKAQSSVQHHRLIGVERLSDAATSLVLKFESGAPLPSLAVRNEPPSIVVMLPNTVATVDMPMARLAGDPIKAVYLHDDAVAVRAEIVLTGHYQAEVSRKDAEVVVRMVEDDSHAPSPESAPVETTGRVAEAGGAGSSGVPSEIGPTPAQLTQPGDHLHPTAPDPSVELVGKPSDEPDGRLPPGAVATTADQEVQPNDEPITPPSPAPASGQIRPNNVADGAPTTPMPSAHDGSAAATSGSRSSSTPSAKRTWHTLTAEGFETNLRYHDTDSRADYGRTADNALSPSEPQNKPPGATSMPELGPQKNNAVMPASVPATATAPKQDDADAPVVVATGVTSHGSTTGATVAAIDFHRTEDDGGRVRIDLGRESQKVELGRTGRRTTILMAGARLGANVRRSIDLTDFATPVASLRAFEADDGVRVSVTPRSDVRYKRESYQQGREFFIEFVPATAERRKPDDSDATVSLSFQSIGIRRVLQLIGEAAAVNIVVSDSVEGTMALQIKDVPWQRALDIILDAKGLGKSYHGDVITVAPLAEIISRQKQRYALEQSRRKLAPLVSRIIQVEYGDAGDFAELVRSTRDSAPEADSASGTGQGVQRGLLSDRGSITVDDRSNSLLVTDTRIHISEVKRVVDKLDTPVRQVLIKGRVATVSREFTRRLGIQQRVSNAAAGSGNTLLDDGYVVSLPLGASPAGVLSTSILAGSFNIDLALSALERTNNGRVISSPRVITADGQEASIEQGREIPYQQGSQGSLGGVTVAFKDVVLKLSVKPNITPNNKVNMQLVIAQDSVGENVPTVNGGSVPSINTRNLTTHVLVDNGDTVVLGGIRETQARDDSTKVPVLGDIPLLGRLFRSTAREREDRTLLVFLTPHVLDNPSALKDAPVRGIEYRDSSVGPDSVRMNDQEGTDLRVNRLKGR